MTDPVDITPRAALETLRSLSGERTTEGLPDELRRFVRSHQRALLPELFLSGCRATITA